MMVYLNVTVNMDIHSGTFAQFFGVKLVTDRSVVAFSSVKNVPIDLAKNYCLAPDSFRTSCGLLPLCLSLDPGYQFIQLCRNFLGRQYEVNTACSLGALGHAAYFS